MFGAEQICSRFVNLMFILHCDGDGVALLTSEILGVCFVVGQKSVCDRAILFVSPCRDGSKQASLKPDIAAYHASNLDRFRQQSDFTALECINRHFPIFIDNRRIAFAKCLIIKNWNAIVEQDKGFLFLAFRLHYVADTFIVKRLFWVPRFVELVDDI